MRGRGPGFGEVLGIGEFRALWAAELLSVLGDQLARIALALLVFQQTSSAALSALTYALTFAPAVLGGAVLSGLADRYPRRAVLIATDLVRAGLAGAMAIPSLPLPALWVLVALLSMASGPFKAAQLALLPQILDGKAYVVGMSLRQISSQSAQLVGFASGGLLLAVVEPHLALAGNALTFVASTVLISLGVRARPAPSATAPHTEQDASTPNVGRSQLLPVIALVCVVSLFAIPEGVAAPYGTALGVGSTGVGLLMAADPIGSVVGGWLNGRFLPHATPRVMIGLAVVSGIPLMVCAPGPGLWLSVTLWAISGAMSTAYLVHSLAVLTTLVPDHRRGRIMGRTATCLYTAQGLAIVTGGLASDVFGPFRAVALAGLLGAVFALCVGSWWRWVAHSRRDLVAGSAQRTSSERSSQMSLATSDTSSGIDRLCDLGTEQGRGAHGSHQMSFATTNTSSQATQPRKSDSSHQMSLATFDTSSRTEQIGETDGSYQMSFATSGTSLREHLTVTEQIGEIDSSHQMSLATFNTSSGTEQISETIDQHQMSFATTNTSFWARVEATDQRREIHSPYQMSLATTDTSSQADDFAAATGPLEVRMRRRRTRAPSLWGWHTCIPWLNLLRRVVVGNT
jgi:MFS family permease